MMVDLVNRVTMAAIRTAYERALFKLPNVRLVTIAPKYQAGRKVLDASIVVGVVKKFPTIALREDERIPATLRLDDFEAPTDVWEMGDIRALTIPEDHRKRYRPVPMGVSVGHFAITAGTTGFLAKDLADGETVLVSNNHVLANCNKGSPSDAILQPGPYDGGSYLNDTSAILKRFVPLEFNWPSECPVGKIVVQGLNFAYSTARRTTRFKIVREEVSENLVDVAIASLAVEHIPDVLGVGAVEAGWVEPQARMNVVGAGRTSGVAHGTVAATDCSVKVAYGENRFAYFIGQCLIMGAFCAPGDSGMGIREAQSTKLAGLLFAGSEGQSTIFSPARLVLREANIEV